MAIQNLPLDLNDSTQASSYLYENGTGIAIDYSPYLSRIAASLETIASSLNNGSTPIGTILSEIAQASENTARSSETIAQSLTGMSVAIAPGSTTIGTILSDIAQASEDTARASENSAVSLAGIYDRSKGAGIHMKGPQDWIGLISTYKLYIENAGPEQVSFPEFIDYFNKIKDLPKDF